jgi:hypothetical protein
MIRGYRISFQIDQHHDALVIPYEAADTDAEASTIAVLAARHGYPVGPFTITHIDTGRWCPTGMWANPEHTAIYVN